MEGAGAAEIWETGLLRGYQYEVRGEKNRENWEPRIGSDVSGQGDGVEGVKRTSQDMMGEFLWRTGCPGTNWRLQRGSDLCG